MRRLQAFGKLVVDMILPPTCLGCDEELPMGEPVGFCPNCYARLPWWDKTGVIAPVLPRGIDGFAAPCLYDGVLRDAILRMKFKDGTVCAKVLDKLLIPFIPLGEDVVVVPVPMHRKALQKRLYNQSALLAQAVGKLLGNSVGKGVGNLVVVDGLVRVKPSDGQAKRTRAQRLKFSNRDFEGRREVLEGKQVVLIDDIYTTGATARACALALRRAGAVRVDVVTLAYTPAG